MKPHALAPGKKLTHGPGVGEPCVSIPDVRGEEFKETFGCAVTRAGDEGGDAAEGVGGVSEGEGFLVIFVAFRGDVFNIT